MSDVNRQIGTRFEFHESVRDAFAEIEAHGCASVWLSDEDFNDWPLGEPGVIDCLTRWAMSHRKLTVLARTFESVPQRHPRWATWRRQWSHVVECRSLADAEPGELPCLMLASGLLTLRLFDPIRYRGLMSKDPADALRNRELLDAVSQRSVEAFPSTILGL